jgi:ubiquinone biosynthesis accessory factor UbiJ
MLHDPSSTLSSVASAAMDRMTLAANHWLRAEPEAMARLQPHQGQCIDARALMLPLLPWAARAGHPLVAMWLVTPAGLLERLDPPMHPEMHGKAADVTLSVLSQSVTRWLRDAAHDDFSWILVEGEPGLASDLRWVIDHVRWDVAGDVERLLPEAVAAPMAQAAERAFEGVKRGVRALDSWLPDRRTAP